MHSSRQLPPFDSVVAMLAAVDGGSFSAAAAELDLTHGSVSRRISQLEHWLGTPVFERHARGVVLTPAGQRFAATARQATGLLAASAERWRPWSGRRPIRLSVVPSFARLWLIPLILKLQGDNLSIELITEHRASDLKKREADIAIRYGIGPFQGVLSQLLFEESLIPCASPDVASGWGSSPRVSDLQEQSLLHDSNISQWQAWLAAEGIKYRPRTGDRKFEDYDLVLLAAANGLGIALLRLPTAQAWLDRGDLVAIPGRPRKNPAAHHVVTRIGESRPEVTELAKRLSLAARRH
jgi:LysR family glycine cleavage system transcriptional activator